MTPWGSEQSPDSLGFGVVSEQGGANCGALPAKAPKMTPQDIEAGLGTCPVNLSKPLLAGLLAMVKATGQ